MSTLSSGYTHQLQRKALYADRQNALAKVQKIQPCCLKKIVQNPDPVLTQVNCAGYVFIKDTKQSSSSALESKMANSLSYTPKTVSGIPESLRIRQLQGRIRDTRDADLTQRFSDYLPYRPGPCEEPLPIFANNAGNPIPSIPPCIGPKIII